MFLFQLEFESEGRPFIRNILTSLIEVGLQLKDIEKKIKEE